MELLEPLEPGYVYHIYNRGINGTPLFTTPAEYRFFLKQYAWYLEPAVDTYAYCLLGNHFHLMIRVKEPHEIDLQALKKERNWDQLSNPSRLFAHLFNSYAQKFNHRANRTGSLFEKPFQREQVTSDAYFTQLVFYVHFNPQHHGFAADFTQYPYSSYQSHLSEKPTKLARKAVLDWFGGPAEYARVHQELAKGRNDYFGFFDRM